MLDCFRHLLLAKLQQFHDLMMGNRHNLTWISYCRTSEQMATKGNQIETYNMRSSGFILSNRILQVIFNHFFENRLMLKQSPSCWSRLFLSIQTIIEAIANIDANLFAIVFLCLHVNPVAIEQLHNHTKELTWSVRVCVGVKSSIYLDQCMAWCCIVLYLISFWCSEYETAGISIYWLIPLWSVRGTGRERVCMLRGRKTLLNDYDDARIKAQFT